MAFAIVQHQSGIHGTGSAPGSATLVTPPTVGNLLIAAIGVNLNRGTLTINTAEWTQFEFSGDPTGLDTEKVYMIGLYRYVKGGDTVNLPAFCTAGSTYWTHCLYEISGASGTWNNDLLFSMPLQGWVSQIRDRDMNAPLPALPSVANGSLALTFVAGYNSTTSPTISGSWTLDESGNNNTNYGCVGCASRPMASGAVIDGQWSVATLSNAWPESGFSMILTTAQPTKAYPKHSYNFISLAAGHPTTSKLPWTPQVGNLWIMFLAWGQAGSIGNPTLDSNFTVFDTLLNDTSTANMLQASYRYVQGGDTSAIPNISTAGSDLWAVTLVEITGVPAIFGDAFGGAVHGNQLDSLPMTTTAQTTSRANELSLVQYVEPHDVFNIGSYPTPSWLKLINQTYFGGGPQGYGTAGTFAKFFPSASATVQATIPTDMSANSLQGYIQLLLNPLPPPPAAGRFFDPDIWG